MGPESCGIPALRRSCFECRPTGLSAKKCVWVGRVSCVVPVLCGARGLRRVEVEVDWSSEHASAVVVCRPTLEELPAAAPRLGLRVRADGPCYESAELVSASPLTAATGRRCPTRWASPPLDSCGGPPVPHEHKPAYQTGRGGRRIAANSGSRTIRASVLCPICSRVTPGAEAICAWAIREDPLSWTSWCSRSAGTTRPLSRARRS